MEEVTEQERETLRRYGELGKLELVAASQGRALSTVKAELGGLYAKLGVVSAVAAVWRVFVPIEEATVPDCCSYDEPHDGSAPLGVHWVRETV